ncbi:protein kinase domain-containing protein [Nakamurella deserti]|uniref:protein kinase domain-containing protein n=1 Tax=Nakamurella deserti TaxID=2164074 RepID=UPI000DBE499F|nr:protein kinase [Nakamurella deserti]
MTVGDVIGGYTLTEEFRVVGAGLSEWTFAERGGREYFLKRFLSPTYPDDDAPGGPRTKARKRSRCAAFEAHHRGIMAALGPVTRYGGNLVATLDFFRHGAKYYKVTEKIDVAGLDVAQVAALDFPTRLVLLKTVAHSLKILHDLEIVHSDLKPGNVLVKRTERGHTTKLIDFDNSYVQGSPPPADEIVGTMNYYSPELVRYIQGDADGAALTTASDVFALGLIYAEYLTGALPAFDPVDRAAGVAVLNGTTLRLQPSRAPSWAVELVERMMVADPAARPSIADVHAALMRGASPPPPTTGRPVERPTPAAALAATRSADTPGATTGSALRGRGLRVAGGRPRPVGHPAPAGGQSSPTGGLVGRLVSRMTRRGDG